MKHKIKESLLQVILTLSIVVTPSMLANEKADQHFQVGEYGKALNEYYSTAEVGDPKSFYVLGYMHFKGVGIKQDFVKAFVWYSLAAQHKYRDSAQIVSQLIGSFSSEVKQHAVKSLLSVDKSFGKSALHKKLYPTIMRKLLKTKFESVVLGRAGEGLGAEDILDYEISDGGVVEGENDGLTFIETDLEAGSGNNLTDQVLFNKDYYLVLDYEVAKDGSRRDIRPIQSIGDVKRGIYSHAFEKSSIGTFNGEPMPYTNISFLGSARMEFWDFSERHSYLLTRIKRHVKKFKQDTSASGRYNYAMALTTFPFLKQEPGEVNKILKLAADEEHPKALYRLGLNLYREQKDILEAIELISTSAAKGYDEAEYRLGRLLLESPWIEQDENKALFWLERAANKNHAIASRKAAEILLTSKQPQLRNVIRAQELLSNITQDHDTENPEYIFLQGLVHTQTSPRRIDLAVKNFKDAIDDADNLGWDVKPWQKVLDSWTRGRITVQDLN